MDHWVNPLNELLKGRPGHPGQKKRAVGKRRRRKFLGNISRKRNRFIGNMRMAATRRQRLNRKLKRRKANQLWIPTLYSEDETGEIKRRRMDD